MPSEVCSKIVPWILLAILARINSGTCHFFPRISRRILRRAIPGSISKYSIFLVILSKISPGTLLKISPWKKSSSQKIFRFSNSFGILFKDIFRNSSEEFFTGYLMNFQGIVSSIPPEIYPVFCKNYWKNPSKRNF